MEEPLNPYAAPEATEESTPVGPPQRVILARPLIRLAAVLVDISMILFLILPMVFGAGMAELFMSDKLEDEFLTSVSMLVAGLVLNGFFLVTRGQTIGKMVFRIKIVGMDNELPTPGRILGIRTVLFESLTMIPFVGLLIALADALFIFRPDHRCLHDLAAGTRVIKV